MHHNIIIGPFLSHPSNWADPPPKDEAELEQWFRSWAGHLSRAEQNELARMHGFSERPSSQEGDDELQRQQQRPSLPAEDASRRTFRGRRRVT
ncbi:hypothetical protein F503_06351 [Ophiostoma piceae UAMH 11346]|uniref:Uncharacterized protein n=1 Tax=Ophiostoma piceae (strain UAMH 11346) TaxID=1262450 RepID=S3BW92_OPHP1|nr:hypothetical protein F503_06351 [Ophiostoma piceae UAMH 11346]